MGWGGVNYRTDLQSNYLSPREESTGRKLEDLIIPDHMQEEVKNLVYRWHKYDEKIPAGPLVLRDKYRDDAPEGHISYDIIASIVEKNLSISVPILKLLKHENKGGCPLRIRGMK